MRRYTCVRCVRVHEELETMQFLRCSLACELVRNTHGTHTGASLSLLLRPTICAHHDNWRRQLDSVRREEGVQVHVCVVRFEHHVVFRCLGRVPWHQQVRGGRCSSDAAATTADAVLVDDVQVEVVVEKRNVQHHAVSRRPTFAILPRASRAPSIAAVKGVLVAGAHSGQLHSYHAAASASQPKQYFIWVFRGAREATSGSGCGCGGSCSGNSSSRANRSAVSSGCFAFFARAHDG